VDRAAKGLIKWALKQGTVVLWAKHSEWVVAQLALSKQRNSCCGPEQAKAPVSSTGIQGHHHGQGLEEDEYIDLILEARDHVVP
jgi:hypothetical protein